jgi:hypothetical protein
MLSTASLVLKKALHVAVFSRLLLLGSDIPLSNISSDVDF